MPTNFTVVPVKDGTRKAEEGNDQNDVLKEEEEDAATGEITFYFSVPGGQLVQMRSNLRARLRRRNTSLSFCRDGTEEAALENSRLCLQCPVEADNFALLQGFFSENLFTAVCGQIM